MNYFVLRQRWIYIIFLLLGGASTTWAEPLPRDPQRFASEIMRYEEADAAQRPLPGQILFLGSSTIRLWVTLQEDFASFEVINRGFGGARLAEVTLNLQRIAFPYAPRQIVLFAGGNDLADGHSPEQVLADFQRFVEHTRRALPDVPISYIGIYHNPQRWHLRHKFRETNSLIANFCRHTPALEFIETYPSFLAADGKPSPALFAEDKLHLNAAGYKVLAALLCPHLLSAAHARNPKPTQ
ncbi:GDSL-like Lipase/Acylhydrolase [Lacunisphaera limnophila]|uniref:GDSL-like Lipase/Acylhydrolase n=1 Tax=Lacunisphaera limnophila TaxID=1838286 RepID=A0A1D8ATV5_9BACT|nr:GDSL-type esterase/lipase family protein [Lacunisphaera limnophila]AOS44312.1 GDSL-like Lipase/Acylhydrolase [Lacunisphaera limnophila]